MKKVFYFLMLTIIIGFASCSKADDPSIEIPSEFASIKFEEGETTKTISFTSNQPWTASIKQTKTDGISWLNLSLDHGDAGKASLILTITEDNFSQNDRTAYVHLFIDGLSKSISVTQVSGIKTIADDDPVEKINAGGFYVVNEDWFGHDNGTVNYFKKEGALYNPIYRAYRTVNTNEADWLGTTTQFATTWGDNIYFCSKQGNRLVVADAKTLKKKAIITTIGGDGRSFVGIDDRKGYIGHSSGIVTFNIENLTLGTPIEGVSGQIGTMCLSASKVFAISQKNGLYVIDTKTDKIEKTIAGSFNTLACSKDGNIWIAGTNNLLQLDPVTLETEEIAYPDGAKIGSSWGAWNAGSLCASIQNNVLYWTNSTKVVKYDIDAKTANTSAYTLGKSEFNTNLAFYGAGLRVDPLTDELVLTVKHSGWGASGAYNWIYILNANGQEIANFKVKGDNGSGASWGNNAEDWDGKYFWFPAMPFFEDANKPQIMINQVLLKTGEQKEIDLNEKIVDYDNASSSIQQSVVFAENTILTTASYANGILTVKAGNKPGKTSCDITVISNGVRVNKTVRIDIVKE